MRIYTYPDCPDTKGVLAFLDAQQVPYVLDDLDGLPVNDDCGFVSPTVEVGRDTLVPPAAIADPRPWRFWGGDGAPTRA